MKTYRGACHCGAVGYEYRTALATAAWPVRACQCTFCVKHGAMYTSDPVGSVRFAGDDPSRLVRYRFGQHTADFVFCGRCGSYLGAMTEEDGKRLAVLNLRAMEPMPADLPAPQPMSYDGESKTDRNSRRSARWTPVEN